MSPLENAILCTACGAESFLKRKPRYEGFAKVGEILSCVACGHVFESEADVPFKGHHKPEVFEDEDTPRHIHIFRDDEKGKACRYCRHYVINPFTQRCARLKKTVEATDLCQEFDRAPAPETEKKPSV